MSELQLPQPRVAERHSRDNDDVPFRCPACTGALRVTDEAMTCTSCAVTYLRRDGIYDFRCRRHDYYFNPVPRAEMADIVRDAAHQPWDETVRRFLRHTRNVSSWIDNIAVNGRYTWKLFLELPPGARFLDFGCGLGNMTQNIAPHVGEVVALDLTWERLLFAQQRFAKFAPDARITLVAGGDGRFLPFPDGHFDCIALSGVLEWIADDSALYEGESTRTAKVLKMLTTFFGETNPRRTQLRFLEELRRILRPDGQLFVAIENRWNYEYFTGRPDHHSGLKYGSLLPRFIANLYSIAKKRQPYRTYTHNLPQFRRLFAAAGFPHHECLGLSPGYSSLAEIVPELTAKPYWKPLRAATLKERIKRSLYFIPAFGMAARRTTDVRTSLLGRLLLEIEDSVPALGVITLSECLVTGKDKAVFIGSAAAGKGLILKLPAGRLAQAGEACNHHMLTTLSARSDFAHVVPHPVTTGVHQGLIYYVETAIAGEPLASMLHAIPRASAADKVGKLFLSMHTQVEPGDQIRESEAPYRHLIAEPIAKLRQLGIDPAECDTFEERLRALLSGTAWSVGLQHGDFTSNNILVSGRELSGIVDWEYASPYGLPVLDALGYVESMQRLAESQSAMSKNFARLARWDWPCARETAMLRAVYRHFAVDETMHPFLCQLSWLHHIGHQLDTTARFDQKSIGRRVRAMLAALSSE